MSFNDGLSLHKIQDEHQRERALEVLAEVYRDEKAWVGDRESIFPIEDLHSEKVSWFGTFLNGRVLGVTRILYELPLALYREYGFKLTIPDLDVERFVKENKIAEVGRFAVRADFRRRFHVAALLMRAVGLDAYDRGFSHLITDVFEDDPNTPYHFHRRVLGFKVVATHEMGELNCKSRRITMLLDLREAARRVSNKNGWFYRYLKRGESATGLDAAVNL